MQQTLEQFIEGMGKRPWSEYVTFPGFEPIYVRRGPCFIGGGYQDNILTIANITAKKKNKGNFRKLVQYVQSKGLSILVENVLTEEFIAKLIHMGFRQVNENRCGGPPCFLLEIGCTKEE